MLASGTTPGDRASGAPRRTTARHSRLLPGGDLSGRPTGRATRSVRNRRAAGDGTGRASQRRLHGTPSPRLTGPPAARAARHPVDHPVDQGRPVAGPRQPERAVTTGTTGHPAPTLRKDRREAERIVGTGHGRREWGWRQRRPHLHWAGALGGRCMGSAPGPDGSPPARTPCARRHAADPATGAIAHRRPVAAPALTRQGHRRAPMAPPAGPLPAPRAPAARRIWPSHLNTSHHCDPWQNAASHPAENYSSIISVFYGVTDGPTQPYGYVRRPSGSPRPAARAAVRHADINAYFFSTLPMDSKDVSILQKWPENLTKSRRKGQVNHCRSQKSVTMPLCNKAFSTAPNAVPQIALKYR